MTLLTTAVVTFGPGLMSTVRLESVVIAMMIRVVAASKRHGDNTRRDVLNVGGDVMALLCYNMVVLIG